MGEDVTRMPAYRRARKGLVRTFQLASEFERLTVLENLLSAVPGQRGDSFRGALPGRRYWGADERELVARAEEMLERFGLSAYGDTYAGDLSGGQRRLVEITRALMAAAARSCCSTSRWPACTRCSPAGSGTTCSRSARRG